MKLAMTSFTKAKKSLGQNFLMHARIAERIAMVSELSSSDVAFEIGPGTGMLTRELLKRAKKVIALEADQELFEKLQTDFADDIANGRLELVHGDIRTFDIGSLPKGYAIVANIPYYLTGEIFRMFLETENQPISMTLLVQKEVAGRVAQSKKESILSLSVKAYGTPKREFVVPSGAFIPAPKVDSAVLTIRNISKKNFKTRTDEERFFAIVRAGFAHKRKFVLKNIAEAGLFSEKMRSRLEKLSISAKARAEDLPLPVWLDIAREE